MFTDTVKSHLNLNLSAFTSIWVLVLVLFETYFHICDQNRTSHRLKVKYHDAVDGWEASDYGSSIDSVRMQPESVHGI